MRLGCHSNHCGDLDAGLAHDVAGLGAPVRDQSCRAVQRVPQREPSSFESWAGDALDGPWLQQASRHIVGYGFLAGVFVAHALRVCMTSSSHTLECVDIEDIVALHDAAMPSRLSFPSTGMFEPGPQQQFARRRLRCEL